MKDILIIDIETTGFIDKGGKIVEVGMVSLDLETGKKQIVFSSVCHERPITKEEVDRSWIINNSDLTTDNIMHSPQFEVIKPQIQNIINSYLNGCTAYNNVFDFGFLEDRGIKFPKKLPCPMKLLTPIMKIPNYRSYGGKYKWPNVEEAYHYFYPESNFIEKHRGADDAMHEADIIFQLYKMNKFEI